MATNPTILSHPFTDHSFCIVRVSGHQVAEAGSIEEAAKRILEAAHARRPSPRQLTGQILRNANLALHRQSTQSIWGW